MKTHHTDEEIQTSIDAACQEVAKTHPAMGGIICMMSEHNKTTRLALARALLERLPEPTPPVGNLGQHGPAGMPPLRGPGLILEPIDAVLNEELDKAQAINAELLERLQDRVASHLHASARDTETIQRQAIEIDAMRSAIKIIYDATECCADGAPDATAHDKLCNEISSQLKPHIK